MAKSCPEVISRHTRFIPLHQQHTSIHPEFISLHQEVAKLHFHTTRWCTRFISTHPDMTTWHPEITLITHRMIKHYEAAYQHPMLPDFHAFSTKMLKITTGADLYFRRYTILFIMTFASQ